MVDADKVLVQNVSARRESKESSLTKLIRDIALTSWLNEIVLLNGEWDTRWKIENGRISLNFRGELYRFNCCAVDHNRRPCR